MSAKKLILTIIVILLISVLGWGYYYFFLKPRPLNIGLEFSKPDQVLASEPFILSVSFSNYTDQMLKNAKLSLILPDGVSFLGQSQDRRVMEQEFGDLGPGSINQKTFNLIVLSGSQTLKHIEAKLGYQTAASSAQFENKSGVDIVVGQPAISLSFDAPQNVFSGQNFDITIHYQNNSNQDFKNLQLKIDYPPVFQFQKANLQPNQNNNQWNLGTFAKNASSSLTITGSVVGQEQSYFGFNGSFSADFLGQTYSVANQTAQIMIAAAPLSLSLNLNNAVDYVANLGDDLNYTFHYKNNSTSNLGNITLKAVLIGELFDFSNIRTNAFFDPLTKAFSWLAANTPELANLAPGQEGNVTLEIKLKNNFPIRRLSDKNYTLKIQARIESPTVPQGTTAAKTVSVADYETKVAGKLDIQAKALWRDAPSGILNHGPYPPRVNQPTQYTIHWLIANYATDVSNIQISAFLQSGSRWTGVVKTNQSSQPTYDANSGKVSWNLDHLSATTGVISQPAEAIFQVEVTPAVSQLHQNVPLLSETQIQAQDDFTNLTLNDSAPALDTSLPDDKTITAADRSVQQ